MCSCCTFVAQQAAEEYDVQNAHKQNVNIDSRKANSQTLTQLSPSHMRTSTFVITSLTSVPIEPTFALWIATSGGDVIEFRDVIHTYMYMYMNTCSLVHVLNYNI